MSAWDRKALAARRHQTAIRGVDFEREAASNVITTDDFEPPPPAKHPVHYLAKQGRKTACGRVDVPRSSSGATYIEHLVDCEACRTELTKRAARRGLTRTMGDVAMGRRAGGT